MIIYNVTVSIDKEIEKQWLDWMKNTHIPDVMNTALFLDCKNKQGFSRGDGRPYLCHSIFL